MEEPAVQQQKQEGLWEGGQDGGKVGSFSSILKHSCLLCWSSPRDTDVVETDEHVLAKATEIRELENTVAVEHLELQEQQSDRKDLEETLEKLEKHKEKLMQQIKTTRQLCYEESQQILSLQAEEVQKESQVEEYERELARARWRLRRLREEVKQAKRKTEEAGERNTPLQDSIRQSYEEIIQVEHTLCALSGGAVTPDSQVEVVSMSPADTTEDEPLPVRPWGRSQSLPAYADLIMGANGSAFCNNLADTREEADYSSTCSPQMDRSDVEDEAEEGERNNTEDKETQEREKEEEEEEEEEEERTDKPNPVSQLDFYQADPFAHCQREHDLFNEDLFPKTDTSDGFAADPFKGSDPFAADVLFPEGNLGTDEGAASAGDEGDASLSCAENKASTGTQCFESEFPDEDSDIEISYSREDLDALATVDDAVIDGFKPMQSSSEVLEPETVQGWRSQGQYSVESDPNGYEMDLGAVSPPSDVEEHSLASPPAEAATTLEQGLASVSAGSELVLPNPDWTDLSAVEQILPFEVTSSQGPEWVSNIEGEPQIPAIPQSSADSQDHFVQADPEQESFELSYEAASQSSFDPYGFKLSPEHSNNDLLDPDEAELSPEPNDLNLTFEHEPSSPQPDQLSFDPYVFDITSSLVVRDYDPYGFKLSPEEENKEVLDLCDHNNQDEMSLCRFDSKEKVEPSDYSNQEMLEACIHDNQEVIEPCSHNDQVLLDLWDNGNQEVLQPSSQGGILDLVGNENQELELSSCENKEVLEPCYYSNQEQLEPCKYGNQEMLERSGHSHQELLDFSCFENQEVLDIGSHGNQELLDLGCDENQELLDLGIHDNQEVLDLICKDIVPEANNNNCSIQETEVNVSPTNNSSDSDQASEVSNVDLLGLELSNTSICTTNTTKNTSTANPVHTAAGNVPTSHNLLEGDLSSVFGAGGYIGCPDVADDLEPLQSRQVNPVAEPARPVRPVRPPRPSLRAKEKAQSNTQGIDLK